MNAKLKIDQAVYDEVMANLAKIELENKVVILQAIESGSRAWGFPSPDSDYDVRFIYAHPKDWYLQLSDERDIIELPISDELDIAGWDIRKAFNLANKGNAVVQEWMISPIVYQQATSYQTLNALIAKTFNPIAAYHHYRSMAKKAYLDIEQSEVKKLKRFFYFARATLSAKWILEKKTMPSIVFTDLVKPLISEPVVADELERLITQKAKESEQSVLNVSPKLYEHLVSEYQALHEGIENIHNAGQLSNHDFRDFLNSLSV